MMVHALTAGLHSSGWVTVYVEPLSYDHPSHLSATSTGSLCGSSVAQPCTFVGSYDASRPCGSVAASAYSCSAIPLRPLSLPSQSDFELATQAAVPDAPRLRM